MLAAVFSLAGLAAVAVATARPELSEAVFTLEWSVPVSVDAPASMHVEPWLAVNPGNTDHLIAASIAGDETMGSVIYTSVDGGRRWRRAVEAETGEALFPDVDPVIAFAPDGVPFFSTIADGYTVWRGQERGTRWRKLGTVPGGIYDRQWMAFDGSGGPNHGRMYTAGKITMHVLGSPLTDVAAFSSSDDEGATFEYPALVLPNPGEEGLHVVTDLAVGPDGAVLAVLHTFRWPDGADPDVLRQAALVHGYMLVMRSMDGRRWEGPVRAASFRMYGRGEPERSAKGMGGGRLALDYSRDSKSYRAYLVWTAERDDRVQVMLAASRDGGRTWSEPVRVNDGGFRSNHSNPAVAVNDLGHVAVLWNDRRDDPADRCFRPYVAVSIDGGRSFSPNLPVHDRPVCPGTTRWQNGGDTQGIVALRGGAFQLLWIGPGDQTSQLWTSRVQLR